MKRKYYSTAPKVRKSIDPNRDWDKMKTLPNSAKGADINSPKHRSGLSKEIRHKRQHHKGKRKI
jgi:hypothetical protein